MRQDIPEVVHGREPRIAGQCCQQGRNRCLRKRRAKGLRRYVPLYFAGIGDLSKYSRLNAMPQKIEPEGKAIEDRECTRKKVMDAAFQPINELLVVPAADPSC